MIVGLVSNSEIIERKFEVRMPEKLEYLPNYNLHPGDDCVFVGTQKPNELITMHYGLIPFWTKDSKEYYHAPMEGSNKEGSYKNGIILDPVFRKPIREQRGLLPVDYFIVETDSGIPYLVFLKEKKQRPIGLACVWDMWKKEMTDDLSLGFSIMTIPSYGKFQKIGVKRMPIILPEHHYKKWLRNNLLLTQVTQMFCFYDDKELNAFPISPEILNNRNNDRALIEAKGEVIEKPKSEIILPKRESWFHRRKRFEDTEPWAVRRLG